MAGTTRTNRTAPASGTTALALLAIDCDGTRRYVDTLDVRATVKDGQTNYHLRPTHVAAFTKTLAVRDMDSAPTSLLIATVGMDTSGNPVPGSVKVLSTIPGKVGTARMGKGVKGDPGHDVPCVWYRGGQSFTHDGVTFVNAAVRATLTGQGDTLVLWSAFGTYVTSWAPYSGNGHAKGVATSVAI